jgi:hypothetical protein
VSGASQTRGTPGSALRPTGARGIPGGGATSLGPREGRLPHKPYLDPGEVRGPDFTWGSRLRALSVNYLRRPQRGRRKEEERSPLRIDLGIAVPQSGSKRERRPGASLESPQLVGCGGAPRLHPVSGRVVDLDDPDVIQCHGAGLNPVGLRESRSLGLSCRSSRSSPAKTPTR